MKTVFQFLLLVSLIACAGEDDTPPVTIFEGVVLNDDTGLPFENVEMRLSIKGCSGFVVMCHDAYNFDINPDGTFSITMPWGKSEEEHELSLYSLVRFIIKDKTVVSPEPFAEYIYYDLISCGYEACDYFSAGGKYVFEFRLKPKQNGS